MQEFEERLERTAHLKVGAMVILTFNLAEECGLCNGAVGEVLTVREGRSVDVRFRDTVHTIPVAQSEREVKGPCNLYLSI